MPDHRYFIWHDKAMGIEFPYIVFEMIGMNTEKLAAFRRMDMATSFIFWMEEVASPHGGG
jgi:hypothetical protein